MTQEDGFVKVVAPIDDTPADRAGMEAGDFITHIDGQQTLGLPLVRRSIYAWASGIRNCAYGCA